MNENIQLDPQILLQTIEAVFRIGKNAVLCGGYHRNYKHWCGDDLMAIAEFCQRYDLWLHVDGAYGGSVIFSDQHRILLRGIESADSITIDPHKWMAMPLPRA